MSIYYEDDLVTLWHGDCREVTAWLEADVLVTDPPYGTLMQASGKAAHKGGYGRRNLHDPGDGIGARIANDDTTECRDEALAAWGARGPALVFGSPRQPDPPGEWADRLVWDKKRPGMNGGPWRYRHESIYVTAGFVRTDNAAVSIIAAFPEQDDHIHGKPIGSDADNIERLQRVRGRKPRTYATRERTKHGSAEQREWRTAVFQRDDYTCQMCGAKGVRLQADHIQPYSTHPELRFDLANGRTLCEPCHRQTPTYGWRGYWLKRRQADEIAAKRLAQDTLFGGVA